MTYNDEFYFLVCRAAGSDMRRRPRVPRPDQRPTPGAAREPPARRRGGRRELPWLHVAFRDFHQRDDDDVRRRPGRVSASAAAAVGRGWRRQRNSRRPRRGRRGEAASHFAGRGARASARREAQRSRPLGHEGDQEVKSAPATGGASHGAAAAGVQGVRPVGLLLRPLPRRQRRQLTDPLEQREHAAPLPGLGLLLLPLSWHPRLIALCCF